MPGEDYVGYIGDNGMAIGLNIQSQPMRWTSLDAAPQVLTGASFMTQSVLGNQAGTIVSTNPRIMRWKMGAATSETLGTLTTSGFVTDYAYAINDSGTIVGASAKTGAGFRAVRWSNDSPAVEELAALPNVPASMTWASYALDVNRDGYIVGVAPNSIGSQRAVLWSPDNHVATLDSILGTNGNWKSYRYVSGISDVGFVSGIGTFLADGASANQAYSRVFLALIPSAGTYGRGDANFDTHTNFADLVILAQHYNQTSEAQNTNVADFDLNGVTDFSDLVTLAQNYGTGNANIEGLGGADFAADWSLAQSLVPEPVSIMLLAALPALFRRRGR
jgi:uncharacterized membrane protein